MLSKQTLALFKALPQQALGGVYGDVFWNLMPSTIYVAGTELPCTVYVANPTDEDREYMLSIAVWRNGSVITEYSVRVDNIVWFPVDADSVISLPGALVVGYSDVALVMSLYEREQGDVVDVVSVALTSTGAAGLPGLPGEPGETGELPLLPPFPGYTPGDPVGSSLSSMISMIITVMMLVMMMKMMMGMTK